MNYCFITFRSVTYAQQAQAALERKGISVTLRRTPRWMEARGCGYCLQLRMRDLSWAKEILQAEQLQFRKLYRKTEEGTLEELAL